MDAAAGTGHEAVRDWLFDQARQLLKCGSVDANDQFLDLGGDSLLAPVLANRVEARFGVRPELEEIFTLSFGDLADLVSRERPASR